jgi:hypothetical protein
VKGSGLCEGDEAIRHLAQLERLRIRRLDALMLEEGRRQVAKKRLPVACSPVQFSPGLLMPHLSTLYT